MKELFNVDLVNFYDEKGLELIQKTKAFDSIEKNGSTNEHLLANNLYDLINRISMDEILEYAKYDFPFSKDRNFKFKSGTRLFEARTKLGVRKKYSLDETTTCKNQIIVLEDNVMYIISQKDCN